jgi:hypothetical protein
MKLGLKILRIKKVIGLEITESINRQANLKVEVETEEELPSSLSEEVVEVFDNDDKIIFKGPITKIKLTSVKNVNKLIINAQDYTSMLNLKHNSKSFQSPKISIEQIINSILKSYPKAKFINNAEIEPLQYAISLQYLETDWEFIVRLASSLNLFISPDPTQDTPSFYLGSKFPSSHLYTGNYSVKKSRNNAISFTFSSSMIMNLGDIVTISKQKAPITHISRRFVNGAIINTYTVTMPTDKLESTPLLPRKLMCLSLAGSILKIEADKATISLDIDTDNPDADEAFIRVEQPYSINNSGFFFMPKIGERAHLVISNEARMEPFIKLSLHSNDVTFPSSPDIKVISLKNKTLKLTDDSVTLQNNKINLDITKDGVLLKSNKNIHINSDANISLAASKLKISAYDGIFMVNKSSSVILDSKTNMLSTMMEMVTTSGDKLKLDKSDKKTVKKSNISLPTLGTKNIKAGKSAACGDPVDVLTGNFLISDDDIIIHGANPLTFTRSYNSLDISSSSMGSSFHHNFDIQLYISPHDTNDDQNNLDSEDEPVLKFKDGRQEIFYHATDEVFVSKTDHRLIFIELPRDIKLLCRPENYICLTKQAD